MAKTWSAAVVTALLQYRVGLLAIGIVMAIVAWPLSNQLKMDWKLERMFVSGDPLIVSYQLLEQRFGANQIVVAAYRDPEFWNGSNAGLERLDATCRKLKSCAGVRDVVSLADINRTLGQVRKLTESFARWLPGSSPLKSEPQSAPILNAQDPLAQGLLRLFAGYTHQPGSEYVAAICMLDLSGDVVAQRKTVSALRKVLKELPTPAVRGIIAGEPVMVADGFDLVERDGWRLGVTSTILLSSVLLLCFRSVRWTIIPIAVVHWSILITEAVLAALRLELTIVSSMLTAIVTVIGVATTMHLLLRYQSLRSRSVQPNQALRQTFEELLYPVALACVTDAIGFLSLMLADVGPVRDFGLMMSIGAMVVLAAIVLLVPGLATLGRWDRGAHVPALDTTIRHSLRSVLHWVLKNRQYVGVGLVVVTGLALIGGQRMVLETDFTKNFYASSPLVQGYQTIEGNLGGAGVWDIMLPAPAAINDEYLRQVLLLEDELRQITIRTSQAPLQLTSVLSIADLCSTVEAVPLAKAVPTAARIEMLSGAMPGFSEALLSANDPSGGRWLRIMLRSREQAQADQKRQLIDAVIACVDNHLKTEAWKAVEPSSRQADVTGYHVMLSRLVSNVIEDQWKCFAAATAGIFLVVLFATRSLKFAFAALVPNALPIMVVLGAMGWLGISVNIGAAMIAAVSMGLSIDNSIHYLLHMQRSDEPSPFARLRSAQEEVGLAVVLATIALVAGFLALAVSEFIPTVVFGTMTSLTMLGGLIGNTMVLPLLIAPRGSLPTSPRSAQLDPIT